MVYFLGHSKHLISFTITDNQLRITSVKMATRGRPKLLSEIERKSRDKARRKQHKHSNVYLGQHFEDWLSLRTVLNTSNEHLARHLLKVHRDHCHCTATGTVDQSPVFGQSSDSIMPTPHSRTWTDVRPVIDNPVVNQLVSG